VNSASSIVQTQSWRLGGSIFVLLIAAFFSTLALHHARRWHPDEAFYMTISRNAAVTGDWMLVNEPLDKPPLTNYINALSLVFLGVDSDTNGVLFLDVYKGEFAGRFPALLMSIILVAVIMAMLRTATSDERIACIAGLLATLSPLRIVFAPTAFTDMPMLLFATFALWMAMCGKYSWAGFWVILAFTAKPQCVFYLPLLLGVIQFQPHPKPLPEFREGLLRFAIPILAGGLILWAWDMVRINLGATSFWTLGQAYYTPTMLTPIADYPSRIRELWSTVQYLFGHGLITILLLLGSTIQTLRQRSPSAIIVLLWLIGFFTLHVMFTLNLHDRNLLLILPVACMLVAKALRSKNTPS
jgi:4-amino-4-deoxy-L-arabinose transferase-like glycosyltransferase